jgi:hypothetical protein
MARTETGERGDHRVAAAAGHGAAARPWGEPDWRSTSRCGWTVRGWGLRTATRRGRAADPAACGRWPPPAKPLLYDSYRPTGVRERRAVAARSPPGGTSPPTSRCWRCGGRRRAPRRAAWAGACAVRPASLHVVDPTGGFDVVGCAILEEDPGEEPQGRAPGHRRGVRRHRAPPADLRHALPALDGALGGRPLPAHPVGAAGDRAAARPRQARGGRPPPGPAVPGVDRLVGGRACLRHRRPRPGTGRDVLEGRDRQGWSVPRGHRLG